MDQQKAIDALRHARKDRNLTLYLGAGVSAASDVPQWRNLVASLFYEATYADQEEETKPSPHYLSAIAEWHLERLPEQSEIVAEKIRQSYGDDTKFLHALWKTLYRGHIDHRTKQPLPTDFSQLSASNPTLAAVARLAQTKVATRRCIRAIVTYNFDSLLEMALGAFGHTVIWKESQSIKPGVLPIFHVHGYVPLHDTGSLLGDSSTADELIFSEEQYHAATHEAYSWTNLVQLKQLSSTKGLMIGLSLSDRNIRRLLDAVRKTPARSQQFVLLQRPQWPRPSSFELTEIDNKAMDKADRAASRGSVTSREPFRYMEGMISRVEQMDMKQQELLLEKLNVFPVWYDSHDEVPGLLTQIAA